MIHIQGMGALGVQVAWELLDLAEDFTWSDTEETHTAWHCSTGIVYPSGSERDLDGLQWWLDALSAGHYAAEFARQTPYVFAHKMPPHGGRYRFEEIGNGLRLAELPAVAVNVPEMVQTTRERLANKRTDGPAPGDVVVHAYADPKRLQGYLWGWAARVRFDGPLAGELVTYYAKAHRFNLTYAYPIPGTGQWWAGSTLLHQRHAAERNADRYVDEWLGNAEKLLHLENIEVDTVEQGWRPRRGDAPNEARRDDAGNFWLAPEPTSGLRHGPHIVADLMARMGL